ncbi:hypothetical protein, partial [Salinimicrobium gaetbulicola]
IDSIVRESHFEIIKGTDFKGAIIPADYEVNFNKDQLAHRFTPTREDIIEAEIALTENYNKSMKNDSRVYGFKKVKNVRSHFNNYIRQYLGYVNEKGERIIWIQLVQYERLQKELDNIQLDWKSEIISGLGDVFYENITILAYNKNRDKLMIW